VVGCSACKVSVLIRASATASPKADVFTALRTCWFHVQPAWLVRRYTGSLGKILMPPSTYGRHLRHVAHTSRSKSLHLYLPCTGRKGA
jgi:hypothetical protein